jgi:hypothetical protein
MGGLVYPYHGALGWEAYLSVLCCLRGVVSRRWIVEVPLLWR